MYNFWNGVESKLLVDLSADHYNERHRKCHRLHRCCSAHLIRKIRSKLKIERRSFLKLSILKVPIRNFRINSVWTMMFRKPFYKTLFINKCVTLMFQKLHNANSCTRQFVWRRTSMERVKMLKKYTERWRLSEFSITWWTSHHHVINKGKLLEHCIFINFWSIFEFGWQLRAVW